MNTLVSSKYAGHAIGGRHIIIGASGTIGRQLYQDAFKTGKTVIGTCLHRQNIVGLVSFDIATQSLLELVPDLSPHDCVYLLAAVTNHNLIYSNPDFAHEINVNSTIRLSDEVLNRGAWLLFMSSEIVFGGEWGGYKEDDLVAPMTLYGRQKVEIEQHLRSRSGRWCIVRTGPNVDWEPGDGCPVVKTYRTLLQANALMAYDNFLSITDVRDTSRVLLSMGCSNRAGMWHVCASPAVRRSDLAAEILRTSKFSSLMSYKEVPFEQIEYAEPRPKSTWLDNAKCRAELGCSFCDAFKIIRAKTLLIDIWYAKKGRDIEDLKAKQTD